MISLLRQLFCCHSWLAAQVDCRAGFVLWRCRDCGASVKRRD